MDTCLSKEVLGLTNISCRLPSINLSVPVCKHMWEEIRNLTVSLYNFFKSDIFMSCHCHSPCQFFRYPVHVQPPDVSVKLSALGRGAVDIGFVENTAEILIESPAHDFVQIVGEFGGCFGLFLGVSLVSMYEFLDRFCRSFFARFGASNQ